MAHTRVRAYRAGRQYPGQIVGKSVTADDCSVVYLCGCGLSGNEVVFHGEDVVACSACGQHYKLRVMVGAVAAPKQVKARAL